ncbi:MAG TPA: sulfotransferase, partial [Streptomyces sp.]|nr:sulfotransferase [Streptomyces sp.]
MRSLTFVFGTGRSGSTALSRILNAHPDVLSLNEYMASVGDASFPAGEVDGEEFWQTLFRPAPHFERMIRSGVPLPEFLYTRNPGRYAAETTGIPALSLMVLPHLTDDPDGLLDELGAPVARWPKRTAAEHHRALFGLLCARFGRTAVVERSGYSTGWAPGLREAFPDAGFVHMFRDGPDCALSMSRHPGYRAISLLREIKTRSGIDSFAELTSEHIRALPPDLAPLLD